MAENVTVPAGALTWIRPSDEKSAIPNLTNLGKRIDRHAKKGDFLSAAILARRVLCTEVEDYGMQHHETIATMRQLAWFLSHYPKFKEEEEALLVLAQCPE
jgi:hypothetical protein